MSIYQLAEQFTIKLAAGGYFRSYPQYDEEGNLLPEPEKYQEPDVIKPPKRQRGRIVPYQPTEEELHPKGPWEEETYEELSPGDPYAVGPTGKTVIKPTSLSDEEISNLSPEEFNEWARQMSGGTGMKREEDKDAEIERQILLQYIQVEAMKREFSDIPDLISVNIIGGDDKLFYFDGSKLISIKSRMKIEISQKDLTKEKRKIHE